MLVGIYYSLEDDQDRITLAENVNVFILSPQIVDKSINNMLTSSVFQKEKNTTQDIIYSIIINPERGKILEAMFENEIYETGISNASEEYFVKWYEQNSNEAMNSLAKIFWDNFALDGRKTNILIGILHLLSHVDYDKIVPLGALLASVGTTHVNNEVAEYALKCYENWGKVELIPKLEAMQFHSKWLQEYADEIIQGLKELRRNVTC